GAKGDGVTDDTAAVVEAMSKGGTVMLTAGKTYLVTAPLKVPSDIILKSPDGEAAATIKVGPASAGTTGVLIARASGVTFKNVNFESVKGDFNSLIGITDGDHITITGCKFSKNPKKSSVLLRIKDSKFMDVNHSEFTAGYVAIHSLGNSSDIKIAENKVHDIDQYGIWVQGSVNTFSERVQVLKNDVFNVHRGEGQTAGHMIYVQIGEGISTKRHKNVDVIGNKLIGLDKAFTVGGNGDLIEYCDVDGGSVSENIADKGGDVGIAVIRSSGILLEKNKAGYNNTNGIARWEASNCKVLNNQAYNNNQDMARQWGTKAFKGRHSNHGPNGNLR
ncbi:MAG: right-handed parallel beta-helix repeat-containing protein, partial [Fimbriimonadaceae bacterium]